MDDVFNSGIPAWRSGKQRSRLEELQSGIERGEVKVDSKASPEATEAEAKALVCQFPLLSRHYSSPNESDDGRRAKPKGMGYYACYLTGWRPELRKLLPTTSPEGHEQPVMR
ncbi:hypothetical protein VUR80DRAFT_4675 [Thermomyces stellatus]